jgi:hypothetical protein
MQPRNVLNDRRRERELDMSAVRGWNLLPNDRCNRQHDLHILRDRELQLSGISKLLNMSSRL